VVVIVEIKLFGLCQQWGTARHGFEISEMSRKQRKQQGRGHS